MLKGPCCTIFYPDMGSACDWLNQISHAAQPIKSNTQIWVVTRHQYGISALVSQTSLAGKPVVASPNFGCFLRLVQLEWWPSASCLKRTIIRRPATVCLHSIYFQMKGLSAVEDDSLQFSSQIMFNRENIYDQILIYAYSEITYLFSDVDECYNSPCVNNASSCTNTFGSYECNCASGFTGRHCQIGKLLPDWLLGEGGKQIPLTYPVRGP